MAINVNNVYQTVLLILNKEQRGYMTPDEFNKTATQVQLDIFEQYFDDLNQQLRVPQADYDYTDRQLNLDEKISTFKCIGDCAYTGVAGQFALPTTDLTSSFSIVYNDVPGQNQYAFYKLGVVTHNNGSYLVELERLQRNNFYNIDRSEYTTPNINYPVYLYESDLLFVKPTSIISNIQASFLRKPLNVEWGYSTNPTYGYYEYQSGSSQNFELESSEQVNVILRILQYSGIIIRDPQIVQAASAEIQQNEINKKS
jgi:hypothetical protein